MKNFPNRFVLQLIVAMIYIVIVGAQLASGRAADASIAAIWGLVLWAGASIFSLLWPPEQKPEVLRHKDHFVSRPYYDDMTDHIFTDPSGISEKLAKLLEVQMTETGIADVGEKIPDPDDK